jgi:hypothetical protein
VSAPDATGFVLTRLAPSLSLFTFRANSKSIRMNIRKQLKTKGFGVISSIRADGPRCNQMMHLDGGQLATCSRKR